MIKEYLDDDKIHFLRVMKDHILSSFRDLEQAFHKPKNLPYTDESLHRHHI